MGAGEPSIVDTSSSRQLPWVGGAADAAGDAADVAVGGWAVGGVAGSADSKSRQPDAQREATGSVAGGVDSEPLGGLEIDVDDAPDATAKFAALRARDRTVERQRFLDSQLHKRVALKQAAEWRGDGGNGGNGGIERTHSTATVTRSLCVTLSTGVGDNVARVEELLAQTFLDPEKKRYYKARLSKLRRLGREKNELEQKWRVLRSKNREKFDEVMRTSVQLARAHGELVEARSRSEAGRKKLNKFEARLERAVGVARLLPGYKARVEHLVRQLNEKEARLNVAKGQVLDKLRSAMIRRDDAQHRHELLVTAIDANDATERSIVGDIARIRSETASNEQDLSAAQQMEIQTKLRVETIEHEVSMERIRHDDAVTDLESKAKELDDAKVATARAIEEKKAAIEAKKRQLSVMFAKCNELRKAEGHDAFTEPKWGEEQPPSLDVSRVRTRVAAEEKALEAKKAERDVLRKDVAELDATIAANTATAAEKRAEVEALMKEAAAARKVEAQRKADTERMVAEADVECAEVEKLRALIGELTAMKEANAEETTSKLQRHDSDVSTMDAEIAMTLAEIAAVEKARRELVEREGVERVAIVAEIAKAKSLTETAKKAYEQATAKADNFAALPDDELAMQLAKLDEEERQVAEEADRERDMLIMMEPILEHVKLDWNSDVPIEEQKEAGLKYMRQHCHEILEAAKAARRARVEHARAALEEEKEGARKAAVLSSRHGKSGNGWMCTYPEALRRKQESESTIPTLRPLGMSLYSGNGEAAPVHAPRAAEASYPPPLDCRYDQLRSQYSAVGMAEKKLTRKGKLTDIPHILAFQSTLPINKKVTTSRRTALPAHTALWYDVVMFGRGDACAAFTSREHFDACLERDRRVVLAEHPLREDDGSNIQSQIRSLGEWCTLILEQIRSRLGYNKEAKNRLAELERILRVVDGGVPDLHILWRPRADESGSDEPDPGETDSGETDRGESNSGEPLLDVRELFCSIGDVYSGSCHNVKDAKRAPLTAPRFQMKTAGSNDLRLIDKRQTIRAGLKRDFPLHYGSPFDPNLTIGPDGYRPFFMLNTAEYHVDAEVKAKTLQRIERERQSSYALLRQEQGKQYKAEFEAQDESTRGGYRTFEEFEDEHSDETRKQVIQYNANLDWFHDECLSIERLKQFQSVDGDVAATPYATVLQEVHDALRLVNQHLHLDLGLAQVISFSKEAYTSRPDALISDMVGRIYHHLAPGDTCRHQFCNCKISERIRSAPEHRESHGDHTREAEEIYGRKDKQPSHQQNLDKKLAETRRTLPVSKCCHETGRREDRNHKIPRSRLRPAIRRQPGTTHRTGKQVVMSQRFLLLFSDIVASGALQSVCPLDSDDMQCILVNHTGLTFEECTEKPLWVWDECDDMQARFVIINSILNGVLKRYSERCANPDCPDPDIVNRSTFGLKGDEWDHAYEEDKDMSCSNLRKYHPIQFINEILRACNVTCCRCHGVKTALNNLGFKGQVFDWLLAELDFSGVATR